MVTVDFFTLLSCSLCSGDLAPKRTAPGFMPGVYRNQMSVRLEVTTVGLEVFQAPGSASDHLPAHDVHQGMIVPHRMERDALTEFQAERGSPGYHGNARAGRVTGQTCNRKGVDSNRSCGWFF